MASVGLLLAVFAARSVKSSLEQAAQHEFATECREIQAAIEERLHAHEQVLRSGAAFFGASDFVSRAEFREFAKRQKVDRGSS